MPALTQQEQQVVNSFRSLDPGRRRLVLLELARGDLGAWRRFHVQGEATLREAARLQGLDWDHLNDEQRQAFVEDYLDRSGS